MDAYKVDLEEESFRNVTKTSEKISLWQNTQKKAMKYNMGI